jgi:ribonuclease PH
MRSDFRSTHETRPISAKLGVITETDGSAEITQGNSKAIASVVGPTQARYSRHELYNQTSVEIDVDIAGRSSESTDSKVIANKCQKFIKDTIMDCLDVDQFPRLIILIKVLVVADDGSYLSVALNATILALLDASIPMKKIPNAISVCLSNSTDTQGKALFLDPNLLEESQSDARFTFGIVPVAGTTVEAASAGEKEGDEAVILVNESVGVFTIAQWSEAAEIAKKTSKALDLTIRDLIFSKFNPTA